MNALTGSLSAIGVAIQSIFSYLTLKYQTERTDRLSKEARDAGIKEAQEVQLFSDLVHDDPESAWMSRFRGESIRGAGDTTSTAGAEGAAEGAPTQAEATDTKVD